LRIKPFLPSLEVPLVEKVSIRTFVGEDVGGGNSCDRRGGGGIIEEVENVGNQGPSNTLFVES